MTEKTVKKSTTYSPDQVKLLVELYDGGKGDVAKIAADPRIDRTKRSVIGKLVNMGLYVKADAPVKTFVDTGPTKKETMKRLEALGLPEAVREGLKNATKGALEYMADTLEAANPVASEATSEPVEQAA